MYQYFTNTSLTALRVESPANISKTHDDFATLFARGLPEDAFWSLFIQCSICKFVMPQDVFAGSHALSKCTDHYDDEAIRTATAEPTSGVVLEDNDSISGDTEIIDWGSDGTDDDVSLLFSFNGIVNLILNTYS